MDFQKPQVTYQLPLGKVPMLHLWSSTVTLSSPLHMDSSLDFAPEVALEDLGLPQ